MKTLPTHLNRLDAALRKQGVALKRHQLVEAMAAAFGYHNSNEMTAAAKRGGLDPAKAGRDADTVLSGTAFAVLTDPVAKARYAVEAASLRDAAFAISPYGNLLDLREAKAAAAPAPSLDPAIAEGSASHPTYGRDDWRRDVDAGDTSLGYPEWVTERLSEEAEEPGPEPELVQWDQEHPLYPRADWEYEVANGDTSRGYGDWVEACIERDHEDAVVFLTNGCCENAHGSPALLARHGLKGQMDEGSFYPLTKGEEALIGEDELTLPNGGSALFGYSVLHQGRKWACPVVEFHHEATSQAASDTMAKARAYIDHIAPKFEAMGGKVMVGEVQDDRVCVNVLVPFKAIMRSCGDLGAWQVLFAKHAMPSDGPRVTARFHPQAWVNDYAISVDPEGATEWDVTHLVVAAGRDKAQMMGDDDYASDALREEHDAPRWVREWSGPFRVEVEESIAAYYEALDALP